MGKSFRRKLHLFSLQFFHFWMFVIFFSHREIKIETKLCFDMTFEHSFHHQLTRFVGSNKPFTYCALSSTFLCIFNCSCSNPPRFIHTKHHFHLHTHGLRFELFPFSFLIQTWSKVEFTPKILKTTRQTAAAAAATTTKTILIFFCLNKRRHNF